MIRLIKADPTTENSQAVEFVQPASDVLPQIVQAAIFCARDAEPDGASVPRCSLDIERLYNGYLLEIQNESDWQIDYSNRLERPDELLRAVSLQIAPATWITPAISTTYSGSGFNELLVGDSASIVCGSLLQLALDPTESRSVGSSAGEPYSRIPVLAVTPRLLEMADLEEGWDGYSGKAIDESVVNRSLNLLGKLAIATASRHVVLQRPNVGPTPSGSIMFEWDLPGGSAMVECPPRPENISFYIERSDGSDAEGEIESAEALWEVLAPLAGAAPFVANVV